MLADVFANLATSFADQFGAPFVEAAATWPGVPVKDAGGSIVTPGTPIVKPCRVQFDAATEAMRNDAGFISTDVRLLVLAGSLSGLLDETAHIVVATGAHAGTWSLLSCRSDPAGIGYECRARKIQ